MRAKESSNGGGGVTEIISFEIRNQTFGIEIGLFVKFGAGRRLPHWLKRLSTSAEW